MKWSCLMASCGNDLDRFMSASQKSSTSWPSKSPRDARKTWRIVLYYYRKQRSGHANRLNSSWIGISHGMRNEINSSKEARKRPPTKLRGQKAEASAIHRQSSIYKSSSVRAHRGKKQSEGYRLC